MSPTSSLKLMSNKYLRNQIIYIAVIILIAAAVLFIFRSDIMNYADQHIVLENKYPQYSTLLESHTEKTLEEEIANNGTDNLVINELYTNTYDQGFIITVNEDGSFTYSGTNHSDNEVILTIASYCLPKGKGTYIISDTKTIDSEEVSQEGISIFLQNQCYNIGGNTDYPYLYSLKNGPQTITIDENDQSEYYLNLDIQKGFSSDGVTFYPMITTEDHMSSAYQPCVIYDTSAMVDTTISYDYYQFGKNDFLQLGDEELNKFENVLNYQNSGSWTTIDFQDGTGAIFTKDEHNKYLIENCKYGFLNSSGKLSSELGSINDIKEDDSPLNTTISFRDYIGKLNNHDYTILISVRDDGFSELVDKTNSYLRSLGIKIDISNALYQNSYYAVLNPGNNSIEQVSDKQLEYSGTLKDGSQYQIISRGHLTGNDTASIIINGQEYSMNRRGMNFVVYDNSQHRVVDTVCFDTCNSLHCYRPMYIP